jgi:DNA-binding response OmpR family regulator
MTNVLIVDDDEQLRNVVSRVLTTQGFDCAVVESIPDAQASIATRRPDIVLLDIGLGTSSGLDIHRVLRGAHARLPAVIFTTSHRDVFPAMLEQLGPMDDWIIRPWDTAEFIARVRLAARRVVADRAATDRTGEMRDGTREQKSTKLDSEA